MPRQPLPFSEAPLRLAIELRRARIEGPLSNDDAGADRKGLRYFPRPPRLDSRPFTAREIALGSPAMKRRKRSRSRTTMLFKYYSDPVAPKRTDLDRLSDVLATPVRRRADGIPTIY